MSRRHQDPLKRKNLKYPRQLKRRKRNLVMTTLWSPEEVKRRLGVTPKTNSEMVVRKRVTSKRTRKKSKEYQRSFLGKELRGRLQEYFGKPLTPLVLSKTWECTCLTRT